MTTYVLSIPQPLDIEGRPELHAFPVSVTFAQFGGRQGKPVLGSAVYEPDVDYFKIRGDVQSLVYFNTLGGKNWLRIDYRPLTGGYIGWKYVNGKQVGSAVGGGWEGFFTHFTRLGLSAGEPCSFTPVGEGQP